ncbi:cytidylyltransferase domain-containing protein, partial [Phocaeicola barnesiae]
MKVLAVIPARYQSSRLPGKPIVDICGKPMIWWVYQQASKAKEISDIIIATDDKRIEEVCKQLDMKVIMTSPDHDTPTSRLYEVSTLIDADLYLQLMGDEPLINAACFPLIIPSVNVSEYYVAALSNTLKNPTEVIDFSIQKEV